MLERPGAVTAIVTQNGNAYEEGFGGFWDAVKKFWANPVVEKAGLQKSFTSFETTKWQVRSSQCLIRLQTRTLMLGADLLQYLNGAPNPSAVAPETYHLDYYLMTRPGNTDIQMDIIFDYQYNVKLYPEFHKYFREHKPPVLAVWGKHDEIFIWPGAEAYKRDNPKAEVHLLDAGHFTL